MIVSQYHVFGSGHATIYVFIRPHLTIGQYVDIMSDMYQRARDDGHNGFVGTMSADDHTDSIRTKFQNYTGVRPMPPNGFVHEPGLTLKGMTMLVEAGFSGVLATEAMEIFERIDKSRCTAGA